MINVESSNIERIGWINDDDWVNELDEDIIYNEPVGDLYVEFKSGKSYRYYGVEQSVYNKFLTAESMGKYFNKEIKGYYDYEELDVPLDPITE